MLNPYVLIGIAILVAATLGGTYYKGHQSGAAGIRVEWAAANAKAAAEAEAQRSRQEQLSRDQAKTLETKLAGQRRRNAEMQTVVDGHIRAANFNRSCKLTDSLLGDVNRALAGAESPAGGSLPDGGSGIKPAVRPVDGKPAAEAARSR